MNTTTDPRQTRKSAMTVIVPVTDAAVAIVAETEMPMAMKT